MENGEKSENTTFSSIKKKNDESVLGFNKRLNTFYKRIPQDIIPSQVVTKGTYATIHDTIFYLMLSRRKPLALDTM